MEKIQKPYYQVSKSIAGQIKSGSKRKKKNVVSFLWSKLLNYLLERMAYNCPFNSLRVKFHKCRGVKVGKNVLIGMQVTLDHSYPEMITIEDDVSLAGNNYILAHSNPYQHFEKVFDSYVAPVVIKQGAWIGIGAIVLPEVIIGEYSVIAAGSVVTKSIPAKSIAGGMPAKVLKDISDLV
jgi:acetyltransferase-like isoleucine patch superfamily enzyme